MLQIKAASAAKPCSEDWGAGSNLQCSQCSQQRDCSLRKPSALPAHPSPARPAPASAHTARRVVTAAAHRQPPPGAAAEGPILVLFLSHSPPERGAFPSCNSPQTPQCCPGLSLSRAGQEESSGTGVPGPFPGRHAVLGHKGAEARLSQLVAGPSLLANHTRPAHWAERKISACTSSFCGRRADGWGAGSIQLPRALRGDEI